MKANKNELNIAKANGPLEGCSKRSAPSLEEGIFEFSEDGPIVFFNLDADDAAHLVAFFKTLDRWDREQTAELEGN